MQKWTDEQRRKFKATMRQKKAAGVTTRMIEELPVRHAPYNGHGPNDDAEEFAKFMAAAWRIFKHGN